MNISLEIVWGDRAEDNQTFYHKVPALSSLKIKPSNYSVSNGCILICDNQHGWAGQDSC